jgi:hypothetical protein
MLRLLTMSRTVPKVYVTVVNYTSGVTNTLCYRDNQRYKHAESLKLSKNRSLLGRQKERVADMANRDLRSRYASYSNRWKSG